MMQCIRKLINLLQRWKRQMLTPNYNPIPTLIQLCELFEEEIKKFTIKYPDPSDERHPSYIDPTCPLNQMYKILFSKHFKQIIIGYLKDHNIPRQSKDDHNLNVAACRLIINIIPYNYISNLETSTILENPKLIQSLFIWAENSSEPLQTYATGLLASCMDDETAGILKEHNNKLVPIIMDRLQLYYIQFCEENENNQSTHQSQNFKDTVLGREKNGIYDDCNSSSTESNASNWIQIYPPNLTTKLVYCLKYLVTIGKHQEFLSHAYEKCALILVMKIINSSEKQNSCLAFEALKYLSVLLCHKQFAAEFIVSQGLQKLLLIPKPSIPSIGVSICFSCLSYSEEVMEKIFLLPEYVDLVKYAIWMLECSHNFSRFHANIFFSNTLHFRVIHQIFDSQDGLRKLFNWVVALPIFPFDDSKYSSLTKDTKYSQKHTMFSGLKHYFAAHLQIEVEIRRAKIGDSVRFLSSTMSTKKSRSEVQDDIELLSNGMSLENHWTPIDQFLKLGGLNLLLKIISLAFVQKFSIIYGCEILNEALEVLNICAVLPKVKLALCEITSPEVLVDNQNNISRDNDICGLDIILKIVNSDFLNADIRKAALSVIITCVCTPIHREGDEAVAKNIWDCFRNYNGIMVLLTLITIKKPITDVDAIRELAIRALAGLARSESVRKIFSKLLFFNSGQLQSLMKKPVLQEKHQEHVKFKKYALELMELVLGKKISNDAGIETTPANINLDVVAQTKIKFDEQQLHLMEKGLSTTAESLGQEANLKLVPEQEFESPTPKLVKKNDQDLQLVTDNNTNSKVSLESIVTEYFTNQHASCKHPMITCPQFNLFVSNKCRDLNPRSSMCTNFAMRFSRNIHSRKLNQRLIHSRFCPTRRFNIANDEALSSTFLSQNRIVIATDYGEIKMFNLFTSHEELSFSAGRDDIKHLQSSNDARMLLLSDISEGSLLYLLSTTENAIYYLDEDHCIFSNYEQNKILGNKAKRATIYDLETSQKILTLVPRHSNEYRRNRATFDATNKLVLSDGVLWDTTAGKEIHKFDKLNQYLSEIFHPNGLEIISNAEVWDVRTFKLLRSVSSLNECDVTFSKSGEGMYLYDISPEIKNSYPTSFKTLDPYDYSNIATIDVKKWIYHIACNSDDTQIAIVENQGTFEEDKRIVQLYDVGISRTEDEDEAVENEDNEEVDFEVK